MAKGTHKKIIMKAAYYGVWSQDAVFRRGGSVVAFCLIGCYSKWWNEPERVHTMIPLPTQRRSRCTYNEGLHILQSQGIDVHFASMQFSP